MLQGKRIAILVEEGFEDSELIEVRRAMGDVGVKVVIVGSGSKDSYMGKRGNATVTVDVTADKVEAEDFDAVKAALADAQIPFSDAEVTMLPQNMSTLEGNDAERMLKLMEAMDDCDDVQKVYTNADIPDEMVDAM